MSLLKEKMREKIPQVRERIKTLAREHGSLVISEVTLAQAYGGMRGVKAMVCDTSLVDPDRGLIIRGHPIADLTSRWPEEIFFLLLTGDLPTPEELKDLREDLEKRTEIPDYVWKMLRDLPKDSHPMCMFDAAILVLERESVFRKRYSEGIAKTDYWESTLEDSLNLLAKLPELAAGVYRIRFNKGELIRPEKHRDMGGRFAEALGVPDPEGEFVNLVRLYLTLHSDHEGGNVSANTCHTVSSALSDPYYAVSAGLNGLAGPLHGLANQECLKFVLGILERYGGVPTKQQLIDNAWELLNSGRVIPGYGHAVLRVTDPRFTAFHDFGKRVCPNDEVFKIVSLLFESIPNVLKEHGKAKDPYPNVDAGSGSLLYHFGVTEFPFYTVFFGVSRAMGMLSQLIINRALGTAITRPKSVTTEWMEQQAHMAVK